MYLQNKTGKKQAQTPILPVPWHTFESKEKEMIQPAKELLFHPLVVIF